MIQVLPKIRSFKEELARNLGGTAGQFVGALPEHFAKKMAGRKEDEAISRLTGQDVSGLSPEMKKEFVKSYTGVQGAKRQEKQEKLNLALGTIERMKELVPDVGPSSALSFFGPKAESREEFRKLGQSLIPFVSAGVQIRNQKEFDEYKKIVTNPNATQAQITGALNGLEDLVTRSLEQTSSPSAVQEQSMNKQPKEAKALSMETMQKFLKQTKGTPQERIKKAKALAKKEGYQVE